jgi:hypothetical protein
VENGEIRQSKDPFSKRLNQEGQDRLHAWERIAETSGCLCHFSPPCSLCTHEDHPILIDETPEYWDEYEAPVLAEGYGTF